MKKYLIIIGAMEPLSEPESLKLLAEKASCTRNVSTAGLEAQTRLSQPLIIFSFGEVRPIGKKQCLIQFPIIIS